MHDALLSETVNGLTTRGIAVASIAYSLGESGRRELQDVRDAIHWLRVDGPALDLDPRRIALDGVSAGAQLLMMAACLDGTSEDGPPDTSALPFRAVVDIAGPADLNRPDWGPDMSKLIEGVFGAAPGTGQGDLMRESPVARAHAGLPPFLVIHGLSDSLVPYEQSVELSLRLQQLGVGVSVISVQNTDHELAPLANAVPNPSLADVAGNVLTFLVTRLD